MKTLNRRRPATALTLHAGTAADLMTPNPVSLNRTSSVREAAAFLTGRGISAAPVIDEAGRPIGVVSRSDILGRYQTTGYRSPVHSVMTPVVFCVQPDTPAAEVIESMVGLGVRRVFVVDDSGVLIGVVSAFDVLRKLCRRRQRTTRSQFSEANLPRIPIEGLIAVPGRTPAASQSWKEF